MPFAEKVCWAVPRPDMMQPSHANCLRVSVGCLRFQEMDVLDPHDEDYEEKLRVRRGHSRNRFVEAGQACSVCFHDPM